MKRLVLLLFVCALARSLGAADVDSKATEIERTPIAKRLGTLGFIENPKGSGLFEKKEVQLGELFGWFGLTGNDLHDLPSRASGEWTKRTQVDGNHTILKLGHTLARGEEVTTNTPVNVVINVAYARPETLFVGIAEDRLLTALSLLGARQIPIPASEATNSAPRLRFVLPDGKGLEVEIDKHAGGLREKPLSPTVSRITVGEEGKAFDNWEQQSRHSVPELLIAGYRQSRR